MKPQVIFEDSDILVLDKPAGLVVDKSETQQGPTLVDWLAKKYDRLVLDNEAVASSAYHTKDKLPRMGIVHRLDKDTSGLLLVAKTQKALENLQKQFQERVVKKEYLALVHGLVEGPGKAEGSVARNPSNRKKFMVKPSGSDRFPTERWKTAITEYESMESLQLSVVSLQTIFNDFNKIQMRKLERMGYGQFTLLRAHPLTGRTHQIRVHLKYIGRPIVADEKYAGRKMYRLDHRWCERQFLHAAKIGFKHPVTGQWIELESKLPADLRRALELLINSKRFE